MRTNQATSKRYTQPAITVDQAREMVWLRAAFPEGFSMAAASFLRTCDMDKAAALMCTVHLGRADIDAQNDLDWLVLLFTEKTILTAQALRDQGDRFHRLMYLFGQVDQTGRVGFDTDDDGIGPDDVFGVDDAAEIGMFVAVLTKKTEPYRVAMRDKMCGMMINHPGRILVL